MEQTFNAAKASVLDVLPPGYELRTGDIPGDLAPRFYRAVTAVSALGVPGAARTEGAVDTFQVVAGELRGLISALGGDISMPFRVRYAENKVDFLAPVGGEEATNE